MLSLLLLLLLLLLNTIYTYIYILLLNRLPAHLSFFPSENQSLSKVFIIPEKFVAVRRGVCASPVWACSPNATYTHTSASSSHMSLQKPMFLNPSFCTFSKSYWRLGFSYGFCMPSTCCKTGGPTSLTKKT